MALYKYTAIGRNGKKIKGNLEAKSPIALATQLGKQSITVISSKLINKKPTSDKNKVNTFFTFSKQVTTEDILVFFRQLATMVDAGVSLFDCLLLLAEQAESSQFKTVLNNVKDDVEIGVDFSKALGKYPKIFPQLTISMIKAAEIGCFIS